MNYLQINSFFLGHLNNAENGNFHSKILLASEPKGLGAAINAVDTVLAYTAAVDELKNVIKKQLPTIITDDLHAMDTKRDKELMYIINTVHNAGCDACLCNRRFYQSRE